MNNLNSGSPSPLSHETSWGTPQAQVHVEIKEIQNEEMKSPTTKTTFTKEQGSTNHMGCLALFSPIQEAISFTPPPNQLKGMFKNAFKNISSSSTPKTSTEDSGSTRTLNNPSLLDRFSLSEDTHEPPTNSVIHDQQTLVDMGDKEDVAVKTTLTDDENSLSKLQSKMKDLDPKDTKGRESIEKQIFTLVFSDIDFDLDSKFETFHKTFSQEFKHSLQISVLNSVGHAARPLKKAYNINVSVAQGRLAPRTYQSAKNNAVKEVSKLQHQITTLVHNINKERNPHIKQALLDQLGAFRNSTIAVHDIIETTLENPSDYLEHANVLLERFYDKHPKDSLPPEAIPGIEFTALILAYKVNDEIQINPGDFAGSLEAFYEDNSDFEGNKQKTILMEKEFLKVIDFDVSSPIKPENVDRDSST